MRLLRWLLLVPIVLLIYLAAGLVWVIALPLNWWDDWQKRGR